MNAYRLAAAAVGFSSMLIQMSLLRELLSVFSGNELVIGLVLGSWMTLVGVGCYLAGKVRVDALAGLRHSLLLSAVVLPATVFLSRTIAPFVLTRGETAGPVYVLLISLASMAACCLLYGFQLTFVSSVLASKGRGGLGQGYVVDSLGSALGGAVFSFAFAGLLDSFQVAAVAVSVNMGALSLVAREWKRLAVALAAAAVVACLFLNLQGLSNGMQYPGQMILAQEYTRYGNLVVTGSANQVSFFENGVPMFTTQNVIASEETVHYPLSQLDSPNNVLLIGGGASGTIDEVLKYPVKRVDYIEIDPKVVELAKRYIADSGLSDKRVKVINEDGRLYLKRAWWAYDAIIVDLPPPTTAQLNRYYTVEFFKEVNLALKPNGVFSIKLPGAADYMSDDEKRLDSRLYRTLGEAFNHVVVFPAGSNIFLASDAEIGKDIAALVKKRGVRNEYVNEDYLRGLLTRDRMQYAKDAVSGGDRQVDTDARPTAYLAYLEYWLSRFGAGWFVGGLFAVLALLIFVYVRLKPSDAMVFSSGFTGMTLELVVILFFQTGYGYVYGTVGLIVAAFMLGLAAGGRYLGGWSLRMTMLATSMYAVCLPIAVLLVRNSPETLTQYAYPIFAMGAGTLTGAVFTAAAGSRKGGNASAAAGSLFSLDFLGGIGGSMVTSLLLIPLIGLVNVCVAVAAISAIGWARLGFEKEG